MAGDLSVTEWLEKLKVGDQQHVEELWKRYADRLLKLARRRLDSRLRRVADEEDVLISVFDAAIRAVQDGKFKKLNDRNDFWQFLVIITKRKSTDHYRRFSAAKLTTGEPSPQPPAHREAESWNELISDEPTPEFAAEAAETVAQLLRALPTEELRKIAHDRLAGHTQEEIAAHLGLSLRTVERRMELIRRCWDAWKPTDD